MVLVWEIEKLVALKLKIFFNTLGVIFRAGNLNQNVKIDFSILAEKSYWKSMQDKMQHVHSTNSDIL